MSQLVLTPEQQKVVDYDGSLVAIAKPGSGKTTVLAHLIQRKLAKILPHQGIIAISYTNKASDELRKRSVEGAVDIKNSFFGTIDRFCISEIIRPFLPHLWGKSDAEIMSVALNQLRADDRNKLASTNSKSINLTELKESIEGIRTLFEKGIILLEANGALAQYVITNSKACQKYLKARYTNVIVDEYQDSSFEQHELFLQLESLGLIAIAVGDPDQSIFGFANKESKYLLSLPKMNKFKTFPITKNHRSHASITNYSLRILDESCELIETNEIRMFYKHCLGNTDSICNWIDTTLTELIKTYKVGNLSNIGILVRTNISGRAVDKALSSKHHYVDTHPLETSFIQGAALIVDLLYYRFDLSRTVQDIIEKYNLDSLHNLKELKAKIKKLRNLLPNEIYDFITEITNDLSLITFDDAIELLNESDPTTLSQFFQPANRDEIQIMTLHKAKGLEFDIVFHLDLHEWILPTKQPGPNNDWNNLNYPDLEQDKNLHYVGVTRARQACFLCTATYRTNFKNEIKQAKPSEFLTQHRELRIAI